MSHLNEFALIFGFGSISIPHIFPHVLLTSVTNAACILYVCLIILDLLRSEGKTQTLSASYPILPCYVVMLIKLLLTKCLLSSDAFSFCVFIDTCAVWHTYVKAIIQTTLSKRHEDASILSMVRDSEGYVRGSVSYLFGEWVN